MLLSVLVRWDVESIAEKFAKPFLAGKTRVFRDPFDAKALSAHKGHGMKQFILHQYPFRAVQIKFPEQAGQGSFIYAGEFRDL
jgi:hypothetical protein